MNEDINTLPIVNELAVIHAQHIQSSQKITSMRDDLQDLTDALVEYRNKWIQNTEYHVHEHTIYPVGDSIQTALYELMFNPNLQISKLDKRQAFTLLEKHDQYNKQYKISQQQRKTLERTKESLLNQLVNILHN